MKITLTGEEISQIKEAQKKDEEAQQIATLTQQEIERKKLKISPQGIVYRVEND